MPSFLCARTYIRTAFGAFAVALFALALTVLLQGQSASAETSALTPPPQDTPEEGPPRDEADDDNAEPEGRDPQEPVDDEESSEDEDSDDAASPEDENPGDSDRGSPEIRDLEGTAVDSSDDWHGYGALSLRFSARDDDSAEASGLDRVRVSLKQARAKHASDTEPIYDETANGCSGSCTQDVDLEIDDGQLDEGPNTLVIEASDKAGNTRERSIEVRKDRVAPGLDVSGALRENAGKWVRDGSMDPTFKATDEDPGGPRSGVRSLSVRVNGEERFAREQECDRRPSCSLRRQLKIRDHRLREGQNEIELRSTDLAGNEASRTFFVLVDRSAPEIEPSGGLWDARSTKTLTDPAYGLRLDVQDGELGDSQSGVGRVDIQVDGRTQDSTTQECPEGSCPLARDWCFERRAYLPGPHTVRAIAYDQLGEPASERSFRVTVPLLASIEERPFDSALACNRLQEGAAQSRAEPKTASMRMASARTARSTSSAGFQALTTGTPYSDAIRATSGLLSYWRLGEAAGATTAVDEQAAAANGTYTNGPALAQPGLIQGDPDKAVGFDGVNEHVSVGNRHAVPNNQAFTAEAWVKPAAEPAGTVYPRIVSREDTALAGYRMIMNHSTDTDWPNRFVCERKNTAGVFNYATGTTQAQNGVRYRVACTYDGTTLKLFVNGTQEASVSSPVALPNDSSSMRIGAAANSFRYWPGTIDEVAFYNRALTATENASHYAAGNDTAPPDTTITSGPSGTTQDDTPTYEFTSSEANSTFKCQVDAAAYSPCSSAITLAKQMPGTHTFRVKATDYAGNEDATPAQATFTVPELIYDGSADTPTPTGWQVNAGDPGPEWASSTERTERSYMVERITPSQGPVFEGTHGYMMETRGSDYGNYDNSTCICERAELGNANPGRAGFENRLLGEGDDVYYGFAVYLPTNMTLADWQVLWQSKSIAPAGWPESALHVDDDNGRLVIDNNDEPGTWIATRDIDPATKGVWHRFVIRIKYSSNYSIGKQEVWHAEGTTAPLLKRVSATTHTLEAGKPNHARVGYYHKVQPGVTNKVYIDGFRAGRTFNSVVP